MRPRAVRRLPRTLRRLSSDCYVGQKFYFLTILTRHRIRRFEDFEIVGTCDAQVVRAAVRTHFAVLAICYMPDHLHLVVEGKGTESNLISFMKRAKQLSAYHVKREFAVRLWARGYHDRIVREDEPVSRYIDYVIQNPVRARLVVRPYDYPLLWVAEPYRRGRERLAARAT